jgi:hypothetical protein
VRDKIVYDVMWNSWKAWYKNRTVLLITTGVVFVYLDWVYSSENLLIDGFNNIYLQEKMAKIIYTYTDEADGSWIEILNVINFLSYVNITLKVKR